MGDGSMIPQMPQDNSPTGPPPVAPGAGYAGKGGKTISGLAAILGGLRQGYMANQMKERTELERQFGMLKYQKDALDKAAKEAADSGDAERAKALGESAAEMATQMDGAWEKLANFGKKGGKNDPHASKRQQIGDMLKRVVFGNPIGQGGGTYKAPGTQAPPPTSPPRVSPAGTGVSAQQHNPGDIVGLKDGKQVRLTTKNPDGTWEAEPVGLSTGAQPPRPVLIQPPGEPMPNQGTM